MVGVRILTSPDYIRRQILLPLDFLYTLNSKFFNIHTNLSLALSKQSFDNVGYFLCSVPAYNRKEVRKLYDALYLDIDEIVK